MPIRTTRHRLAVDAFAHADLAPVYDGVRASISQGDLFRIEAVAASIAALMVLAADGLLREVRHRWT